MRGDDLALASCLRIEERDYDELAKKIGDVAPDAGRAMGVLKDVLDGVDIGASDPEARRAIEFLKETLDDDHASEAAS